MKDVLDVSQWNKSFNPLDYDSVYIRGSIGATGKDTKTYDHVLTCENARTRYGFYHLFKPERDVDEQVRNFKEVLDAYEFKLMPAVDVELNEMKFYPETVSLTLRIFCDKLNLYGAGLVIYTGAWFWNPSILRSYDAYFSKYPLWVASYTKEPIIPRTWNNNKYFMWQYKGGASKRNDK